MDREWIFLLMPINAVAWWVGGADKKAFKSQFMKEHHKIFRLMGFAFCLAVCAWVAHLAWWKFCLLTMTSFTVRLPFTLLGDDIDDHWLNWPWIWVLSAIHIAPCFLVEISLPLAILAFFCFAMNAMVETLSNSVFFRDSFPWAMCAIFTGTLVIAPYCLAGYLKAI